MEKLTAHKATARTPQIITLIVDDSNSMQEPAVTGKSKAQIATESIQDIVITTQANTQSSSGARFLLNIAKFGDFVAPIAEAQAPADVDLDGVVFKGDSGWTNMAPALDWAHAAIQKALAVCRSRPMFDEAGCPPPLIVFLSDGENTGPEITEFAEKLKAVAFRGGAPDIVACGIGMKAEHFKTMQSVASSADLALNIEPSRLAEFIAAVGATIPLTDLSHVRNFDRGRRSEPETRTSVAFPLPPVVPVEPPPPPPDVVETAEQPSERTLEDSESQAGARSVVTAESSEDEGQSHADPGQSSAETIEQPVPPPVTPAANDDWATHMAAGRQLLAEGHTAEAEQSFLGALAALAESDTTRRLESIASLANIYAGRQDVEQALRSAREALALLARVGSTPALADAIAASESVAELLTLAEHPDADALWMRIATLLDSSEGAALAVDPGTLTARAIQKRAQGDSEGAAQILEKALEPPGPGSLAALKTLAAIRTESDGREAGEPHLEKLVAELCRRHGPANPLSANAIRDLRLSYVMQGKTAQAARLKQQVKGA